MLDPVDAMWRTKIKWFRLTHIANTNDATKSEKASTLITLILDQESRHTLPIGASPIACGPANGKIRTRLPKSDTKATGALVNAQEESCPHV